MDFALPNDTQRCAIVGSTGSGKTRAALWQLSYRSYDDMPWFIFDFKGEEFFKRMEKAGVAEETDLRKPPPKRPGIYIIRPVLRTDDDKELVDGYLWKLWDRENNGVFIDEGTMIATSSAYRQIQTQGRSKSVPTITCSQRPRGIGVLIFSEADFIQVFRLNYPEDRKTAKQFVNFDLDTRLPDYYSVWYSVSKDRAVILAPVPGDDDILATFRERTKPKLIFV